MNVVTVTTVVHGRVCLTQHADALVVDPRPPADRHDLVAALRATVGPLRPSGLGGVRVPGVRAAGLLRPSPPLVLEWTEAARRFAENRARVRDRHADVRLAIESIKAAGAAHAKVLLADLDDAELLDEHQLVNVAAMAVQGGPGLCVFDEQGAGKTVTLIFAFDLLVKRDEADMLVVLAPKSMVPEWPRDLERFKGDMYRVVLVTGTRREKREALCTPADVFVTNFETAVSMEDELVSLARARDGRVVLAVDESFYVKNLDARRTQAVKRLREWCGRAYVLCGTPAPNSAHDLVQQMSLVDFGKTFEGTELPEDREAARGVAQTALSERGLYVRHLKEDVLPGLPGRTFHRVSVPLQPHQAQLYEVARQSLAVDLRAIDDVTFRKQITNFLSRRMALLQLCSHPGAITSGYVETPAKLLALDAILDRLIADEGEKVIVWSYFRHSIERIVDRYATAYGALRYDGSVKTVDERRDAVRRFQEDDDAKLLVANPAAAGAGLTLHRARVAVYESMSDQAAHYLQSLDRIHRRGQQRDVEYLVLLTGGTIESAEYDRLLKKQQGASALLGDHATPPPTRELMLTELLGEP